MPQEAEARSKVSVGVAKRSHRKRQESITRPGRAPDRDWSCCEFRSGVPAGTRTIFFDLSRWLRFAPPPANFLRPSGARNSFAEFASGIAWNRFGSHLRFYRLSAQRTQWGLFPIIASILKGTTKAVPSNRTPKAVAIAKARP